MDMRSEIKKLARRESHLGRKEWHGGFFKIFFIPLGDVPISGASMKGEGECMSK